VKLIGNRYTISNNKIQTDLDILLTFQKNNVNILQVAHNEEDDLFDTTIGALQDIAISDEFQDIMNNFCAENCDIFEDTEENKLEYMELFQK
jgi:hypothetical protein